MTPPPVDPAVVVGELSEAQRRALASAYQPLPGVWRVNDRGIVRKALRERGLGHGDYCYLTPFGLAVRAHLLAQEVK